MVLAAIVLSPDVSAQIRTKIDVQQWPAGKVVLTSGDTIYGPLTYHRTEEIVNVLNEDGTISAFSPVNVQYFVAQEKPSNRPYIFRTLMWDMGRDYTGFKKPTFFEQLNQGPLTLIMREGQVLRRDVSDVGRQGYHNASYIYPVTDAYVDQVTPLYYVLLPDGEIVTLRHVRKDLHKLFGNKSREVRKYVRKKKLDYRKPHQLIAIINYFNSLQSQFTGLGT